MKLVHDAIKFPVTTAVGVLLLVLFGSIALRRIPVQLTPTVEEPEITITTYWPGASPREVEREIVDEQEEQLKSLEGLVKMEASAADSYGSILLTLLGILTIGNLEKILSINAVGEASRLMLTGAIIIGAVLLQRSKK